jgi:hypothetical protein
MTRPVSAPIIAASEGTLPRAAFDILWMLLAVLHTCQTIVFSGGRRIPGSLTDSRLVNLLLEHMYHALQGAVPFLSPQQFYPEQGTLLYSDCHWGTFLYYSLFRFMGFSIEGAFQAWAIATALLNVLAAWILMRTLRAPWWSRGPLAFVASSHFMLVGKLGHPQMLPLFPVYLALAALLAWIQTRRPAHLALFLIAFAYVHFAYMYYGVFLSVVLIVLCPLLVLAAWPAIAQDVRAYRWPAGGLILSALLISVCALFLLYRPYASFVQQRGWANPMSVLQDLSPTVSAWFSAQWMSWLYGRTFNLSANAAYDYDKRLFPGFVLLLLPLMAVGASVVRWKEGPARLLLACSVSVLLPMGFVTSFGVPDGSLFLRLANHVEEVRGFRASGRIAYVLLPVQVACLALVVRQLAAAGAKLQAVGACLLAFCVLESTGFSQAEFSFDKRENQRRIAALVRGLTERKSTAPFALTVDKPQSIEPFPLHLDAFEAGLLTGRPCVNGYSGTSPAWQQYFLLEPTVENLDRALIAINAAPGSVEVFSREALLDAVRGSVIPVLRLPSRE